MALPHGNPRWSNAELRTALEQAHNSARDKWGAYLSDLALAYWDAYKNVSSTLQAIDALRKSKAEQAQLFWSVILPAVAGGFLGGIVSLRMKAVLNESGIKFIEQSILVDTAKTVTSDVAKYTVRQIEKGYEDAANTNPWKPTSVDPAQFAEILRNELLHAMVKIDDSLIDSKKPGAVQNYRDQMMILYNSPFIWNAPKEDDLAKWKKDLWKPLEVFLWADWANHRDSKYWLNRIVKIQDGDGEDYDDEFSELEGIRGRLIACGVPEQYVSQTMPSYSYILGDQGSQTREAHPYLNILWIRQLGAHYQDTFLGELMARMDPIGGVKPNQPANLSLRPGSYKLM